MKRTWLPLLLVIVIVLSACGGLTDMQTATTNPSPSPPQTATSALRMEEMNMAADSDGIMVTGMPAPIAPGEPQQQELPPTPDPDGPPQDMFFEDYGVNPFLDTADDHLSTFAMDVDTASYTLMRSYLTDYSELPPADAIRPEEFVNYVNTSYPGPDGNDAFAIHLDAAPAPFGYDGHYLLRVGIQGRTVAPEDRDPALLIFVIDVSGSMDRGDRLELVKEALALLVGQLREDDRVGIVVYSDNSRAVLNPTPASDTAEIMNAINALRPEGSTNVIEGLQLGYSMAEANHREDGLTRVIVLSDGVANVGITEPGGMLETIQSSVDEGITLSTIGFGMGNYNDVLMEQIANDGNGNYFYVDNIREARRIFVNNLTSTLQVIAFDAKIQVDFNPEVTDRYRLIGYENRAIADEDFRDDTVDAGEVGAGHSVTALYEIALEEGVDAGTVATAQIRYQDADSEEIIEVSETISVSDLLDDINDAPADFWLHAAVAEFSELLRESYWAQDGNYVDLLMFASSLEDDLPGEQTTEFLDLIRAAGQIIDRE